MRTHTLLLLDGVVLLLTMLHVNEEGRFKSILIRGSIGLLAVVSLLRALGI